MAACLLTAACNSKDNKKQDEKNQPIQDTTRTALPAKKFTDIQFASTRDTSCGMPLSAGIEDTLILEGKVYGFCSPECKADFVTLLKKQNKR
jgi:YHS domain-containing protein